MEVPATQSARPESCGEGTGKEKRKEGGRRDCSGTAPGLMRLAPLSGDESMIGGRSMGLGRGRRESRTEGRPAWDNRGQRGRSVR